MAKVNTPARKLLNVNTARFSNMRIETGSDGCVCQYKNGENDSLNFHSLIEIQEFIFCSKNKQVSLGMIEFFRKRFIYFRYN